ncbi:hypothetical protein, partial [Collinsella sp. Sow4_E3]|uniref:hypothetical protein n=1 Tax=Collinsella sp. Sow4_E3 TaxID=3438776 RepID=UPI003F8FD961
DFFPSKSEYIVRFFDKDYHIKPRFEMAIPVSVKDKIPPMLVTITPRFGKYFDPYDITMHSSDFNKKVIDAILEGNSQ